MSDKKLLFTLLEMKTKQDYFTKEADINLYIWNNDVLYFWDDVRWKVCSYLQNTKKCYYTITLPDTCSIFNTLVFLEQTKEITDVFKYNATSVEYKWFDGVLCYLHPQKTWIKSTDNFTNEKCFYVDIKQASFPKKQEQNNKHYTINGADVIDYTEHQSKEFKTGAYAFNVLKYVSRLPHKRQAESDALKALDYCIMLCKTTVGNEELVEYLDKKVKKLVTKGRV